MVFKFKSQIMLVIFLPVFLFIDTEAKVCIPYCGNATGVSCPSGYSCVEWGDCNMECLRTGKYQPDDCPMAGCVAVSCPLGFLRDSNQCEGCSCANEDLVKAIERKYNAGSVIQVPTFLYLLLIPLVYRSQEM